MLQVQVAHLSRVYADEFAHEEAAFIKSADYRSALYKLVQFLAGGLCCALVYHFLSIGLVFIIIDYLVFLAQISKE